MVVFHQHHVKKSHTVVGAATYTHGVLLQRTETGHRLAGVQHLGLAGLQGFLEGVCNSRHAGELLYKVQ